MANKKNIAVIGGGPAGLMAAEMLAQKGFAVTVYDRMQTLGRKFLMAGRGGLNLTHSENIEDFISRYNEAANWLAPYIREFTPRDLRVWCEGLGEETFVGSSGRVFPRSMKAAPLLRAWIKRLNELGVEFAMQHSWLGFEGDKLKFSNSKENILVEADATILALGGASWPRLGSDGGWVKMLAQVGVEISNLRPANSGFVVKWSDYFSEKFQGTPLKPVVMKFKDIQRQGEIMITKTGVEGGAIYALSAQLREEIIANGSALMKLDLSPNLSPEQLQKKLEKPRGGNSFSNYLRKAGLSAVTVALLREAYSAEQLTQASPNELASYIKNLPLALTATTDIAKAISTAGGIKLNQLDENFMLKAKPSVFAIGEMLDWEAPTGGYLLQACFSTAVAAAKGVDRYLKG
jgi:hypothetical protein